jgi:hypothetical protein
MKLLKSHPLFSLLNSYFIDSPQPVNIFYLCNFGFLLGICLVIQIITGIIETGTFDYVLRMLTEIGIVLEFKLGEKFEDMCYLLAIIPLFRNKGKHNLNLISSLKTWLKGKGFIPEFIQGIKHGSSLVTLPKSIENYHNSLLGRMIRVVGGTAAFIVLTINNPDLSLIDKEVHKTLFLTILFIGIYHLSYMVFIYTIRFLYILYHIIKGNWIVRNSPVKWFTAEGSAVLLCFKGVCVVTGIWAGAVGVANGLDEVIGEDYFKTLPVIKTPALMLKASMETMSNNIYFGNPESYIDSAAKDKLVLQKNIAESKLAAKLKDLAELSSFKSSIINNPEIAETFSELKKEMGRDIISDVDSIIKRN